MKHFKTLSLAIIVVSLLVAPLTASAQYLLISDPGPVDMGDVVVGETSTALFELSVDNGVPILIISIATVDAEGAACGEFYVTSEVPPPPILLDNDPDTVFPPTLDVVVEFAPDTLGYHSCSLIIDAQAAGVPDPVVLSGYGVAEEPASEVMAALLEFFDEAALEGDGPGNSADNRLNAFGNMLDTADDLISAGDYDAACEQLASAYGKTDGADNPPDFIADGPDKATLADMILNVMSALCCP